MELLFGDVNEDLFLTALGEYYLDQQLFVKEGKTLTIEAGTTIYGRYDANYSADNPAPCIVVDAETDTSIINFKNSSKRFLPALIINYSLSEKSKIRSSFSRTVARAQFREYAPYVFQEFLGADETIGYPHLKNTTRLR